MPARLIRKRVNAGLTLAEAARQMGVDQRTLKRAEAGLYIQEGPRKKIAEFWGYKSTDIWPLEEDEAA